MTMNFLNVCKKVLLVQPSSEAVFSLLENSFNNRQNRNFIDVHTEHNNLSWSIIGTFLEHNW